MTDDQTLKDVGVQAVTNFFADRVFMCVFHFSLDVILNFMSFMLMVFIGFHCTIEGFSSFYDRDLLIKVFTDL